MRYVGAALVAVILGCSGSDSPASTPAPEEAEPKDAAGVEAADAEAVAPPDIGLVYSEPREPCADRNPVRNLYWGDTHIHTRLSFDAWVYEIRTGPADAYRFAKGEPVLLPPLDANGVGTRAFKLRRPLDFAVVTDHSEFFAEVSACITPGSPAYDEPICVDYREGGPNSFVGFGLRLADPEPSRIEAICGEGKVDCLAGARGIWKDVVQTAAEEHYDRTAACGFTTFVGYEYSGSPNTSNFHRNVIFRNHIVPAAPTSYLDEPTAQGLWRRLREDCLDADTGCDVLAIPHNPNWSNGNMFVVEYPGAETVAEQAQAAAARARIEPLVEIFQHKGDSECQSGFNAILGTPDELCERFEKQRPLETLQDCGETPGAGAILGVGCTHRLDFVRGILLEGLVEQQRIGQNPYKLGIVASTDTHAGLAGATDEDNWPGHLGTNDVKPEDALGDGGLTPGGFIENPGGLAAVWAVENSRDAIFDALLRRETYGTSGTRIGLRFFGGWDLDSGLCEDPKMLERAYGGGVPMGADLPAEGAIAASHGPRFVVQATRDPLASAAPLQRLQIIKGYIDEAGERHQRVFDVAGDAQNGASVDTSTCERSGEGFGELCAVWTDPEFDPARPAFYYARAVENPSCRWSTYRCNALPQSARPKNCDDPGREHTVAERAWSSPIWFTPPQ